LPFLHIYSNVFITVGLLAAFSRDMSADCRRGRFTNVHEDVLKAAGKRCQYAVAGGVALVLYGVVRLTADLDLIVDLDRENLKRFIQAMKELGYGPRSREAEDLKIRRSGGLESEKTWRLFIY
jgi:hypothetical protein